MYSLSADGDYSIPMSGTLCGPVERLQFFKTFTIADVLDIDEWEAFLTCLNFARNHVCDQLRISVEIDCADRNGAGKARVTAVYIHVPHESCTGPNESFVPNQLWHYSSLENGGSYYVGDTIPNNAPSTCFASQGSSNPYCVLGGSLVISAA